MRFLVILAQAAFTTSFLLAYLASPRYCHRFVGYLEEQAVVTYTHILEGIDEGTLQEWRERAAPDIAIKWKYLHAPKKLPIKVQYCTLRYWQLSKEATMRDVILAIRADEAHHRFYRIYRHQRNEVICLCPF